MTSFRYRPMSGGVAFVDGQRLQQPGGTCRRDLGRDTTSPSYIAHRTTYTPVRNVQTVTRAGDVGRTYALGSRKEVSGRQIRVDARRKVSESRLTQRRDARGDEKILAQADNLRVP